MRCCRLLLVLTTIILSARTILAIDYNWTNGDASGLWRKKTNWSPVGIPEALDSLLIKSDLVGGPQVIDLEGPRGIYRIEGQTLSGIYTLSNSGVGALEIGVSGTAVLMGPNTPGWLVFDTDVTLLSAGDVRFETQSPSNRIVVNGMINTSAASGTTTLTLTGMNSVVNNVIQVNGAISDGANARMALTAGDAARADLHREEILLQGLSTYTGPTVVNGASLSFNSIGDWGAGAPASALGAPTTLQDGTITLGSDTPGITNAPGTLRYFGNPAAGHSSNRPIRFVGRSPGGVIEANAVGPLVLSGGISSTSSTTVNRGLELGGRSTVNNTISGVIEDVPGSAVQNLSKTGQGKWILSAANTYGGSTSISGGTLAIAAGGSIGSLASPTTITISNGVLSLDGGSVTTREIDRPSESSIDFRSGTLRIVGPDGSDTVAGNSVLDIGTAGAGTLNITGGALTASNIRINGPDDSLTTAGPVVASNIDNSRGGTVTVLPGGSLTINVFSGRLITGAGSIGGIVNGTGGFTKVGAGTVEVTAPLQYSGPTLLSAGKLRLSGAGRLSNLSTMQISAGAELELNGGSTVYSLDGQGKISLLNNANLTVGFNSGGGTFSGTISGGGSLIKGGSGTLILSGNNPYSGSTTIEAGVLSVGSIDSIGAGAIYLNSSSAVFRYSGPALTTNRVINLSGSSAGGTIEASGTGALVLSGNINPSAGNKTLVLSGTSTADNMISGIIADSPNADVLNLAKSGSGKWILSGNNTYAGTTTVSAGELVVGPNAKIGGSTISVAIGATLTSDRGSIAPSGSINLAGTLNLSAGTIGFNSNFLGAGNILIGSGGAGTMSITGGSNSCDTVSIAGPDDVLNISGGTNTFVTIDNSHGGTVNFTGGTLTMDGELIVASGTIGGTLNGEAGLTKVSPGTATATWPASNYRGPTRVKEGRLVIASSTVVPDQSAVTVDAGATLENTPGTSDLIFGLWGGGNVINNRPLTIGGNTIPSGGSVGTFTGKLLGTGSLIKTGNGVFTFAGTASESGTTQINRGTFQVTGLFGGTSGLTIDSAGIVNVNGGRLIVNNVLASKVSGATLKLTSGSIEAKQIDVASGGEGSQYLSNFTWTAGEIHLTGANGVNISRGAPPPPGGGIYASPDRPFRNLLTLDTGKSLIVDQTTTVGIGGNLTIGGGAFTTKGLSVDPAGSFNFLSGTLHVTQGIVIDSTILSQPLGSGTNLIIDGVATMNAPVTLAGGTMIVDSLVNAENLTVNGGTMSIRVGNLNIGAAKSLSLSQLSVAYVGGSLNIAAGGRIDAIGATMNIARPSTNAGQINATDSTLNLGGGMSGAGQMNLINSTVNTAGGAVSGAAVVSSGNSVLAGRLSGGSLDISSGNFAVAAASGTSAVQTLNVGPEAKLNLNNNSLVIRSGSLSAITEQIRAGLNDSGGIAGAGGDANIRLGSMANGTGGAAIYGQFDGVAGLSGGEILLKSTIVGDLNLDGTVSIADFIDLAANFSVTDDATWQKGDLNYDGAITIADFIDLSAHFGQRLAEPGAPMMSEERTMLENFAAGVVPEPGVGALLFSFISMLLRRGRSGASGASGAEVAGAMKASRAARARARRN
jgi:fibronectin-binding autotransporter adhesin